MASFVWLHMIHISPCISSFFICYGYFNSIHIVKFRTIGGCIDCIALLRVLEMLSEDKKCLVENIIEHLMGALGSYVVGAIIEKACNARSTLLKPYMANPRVDPTDKCNNRKEKMLLYQINIVL